MRKILWLTIAIASIANADEFPGRTVIDMIKTNNLLGMNQAQQSQSNVVSQMGKAAKHDYVSTLLLDYITSDYFLNLKKNITSLNNQEYKSLEIISSNYYNSKNSGNNSSAICSSYTGEDGSMSAKDGSFCNTPTGGAYYTYYTSQYGNSIHWGIDKINLTTLEKMPDKLTMNFVCTIDVVNNNIKQNLNIDLQLDQYIIDPYMTYLNNNVTSNNGSIPSDNDTPNKYCYYYSNEYKKSFFGNGGSVTEDKTAVPDSTIAHFNDLINQYNKYCTSTECKIYYALSYISPSLITPLFTFNDNQTKDVPKVTPDKILTDNLVKRFGDAANNKYNLAFYFYGQAIAYACNENVLSKDGQLTNDGLNKCLSTAAMWNKSFNDQAGMYPFQMERYSDGLNDAIADISRYKPNIAQSEIILKNISKIHTAAVGRGLSLIHISEPTRPCH
jgi:hypothetical protein